MATGHVQGPGLACEERSKFRPGRKLNMGSAPRPEGRDQAGGSNPGPPVPAARLRRRKRITVRRRLKTMDAESSHSLACCLHPCARKTFLSAPQRTWLGFDKVFSKTCCWASWFSTSARPVRWLSLSLLRYIFFLVKGSRGNAGLTVYKPWKAAYRLHKVANPGR